MKKLFMIFIFLFLFPGLTCAQEDAYKNKDKDKEMPVGMESIRMGKDIYIVPEGSKITRHSNVLTFESVNEYAARRFHEMNEKIARLDSAVEDLKKEVGKLKEQISSQNKEPQSADVLPEEVQGQATRLPSAL